MKDKEIMTSIMFFRSSFEITVYSAKLILQCWLYIIKITYVMLSGKVLMVVILLHEAKVMTIIKEVSDNMMDSFYSCFTDCIVVVIIIINITSFIVFVGLFIRCLVI